MNIKSLLACSVLVFAFHTSFSQIDELTHKKLDTLYNNFSEGYKTYTVKKVGDCYKDKAITIAHYQGSKPIIIQGDKNIEADFQNFFDDSKSKNQQLEISFKIVERTKVKEDIHDIGYYKLAVIDSNKEARYIYGKIAIVISKTKKDRWKFDIDTNSTATKEEFELAKNIR